MKTLFETSEVTKRHGVTWVLRSWNVWHSLAHCVVLTVNSFSAVYGRELAENRMGRRVKVKVKWSRYRPDVTQRVGRGIALLFHDRGTRRGWVVSSTPRPYFTPEKDPVPILQEAEWASGPFWTGGKSRPHRDSIPDRPARSSVAIPTELPGPPYEGRKEI